MVTDSKGFTLLELIIVIAILGITMAFAAPSLAPMISNNRISSDANDFIGALQLAKAEAVARLNPVIVCKKNTGSTGCVSGGDWSQGWIVFSDANGNGGVDGGGTEDIILIHEALADDITFGGQTDVSDAVRFNPSGTSNVTAARLMTVCDASGLDSDTRVILVTMTGRGSMIKVSDTTLTDCL